MKKFSIAPLFLAPFLACGGGGGGGHITVDGHTGSGSGSGSGSAAPCTATPTQGSDFGSAADQLAEWDNGSGTATAAPGVFEEWTAALNNDTNPDLIRLELYKNSGGVANIQPGTYVIMGDDANYKTCGVCVRLLTDVTQMDYADDYLATSGTVMITSVGGAGTGSGSDRTYGTLAGSFQNLQFQHVTIAASPDFTSTVVGDCTSTLASGNFSATVQYGGSAATPPVAPPSLKVHWDNGSPALRGRHK